MSLERMLRDRVLERFPASKEKIGTKISIARRDIKAARENFSKGIYDWTLAIAYNSMLQAGTALMFSEGYRPAGSNRHATVVRFLHERFGSVISDSLVHYMDKARKKRHRIVYDEDNIVSEQEAANAIRFAEEFLEGAENVLEKRI